VDLLSADRQILRRKAALVHQAADPILVPAVLVPSEDPSHAVEAFALADVDPGTARGDSRKLVVTYLHVVALGRIVVGRWGGKLEDFALVRRD
jgi:hypothetical protein